MSSLFLLLFFVGFQTCYSQTSQQPEQVHISATNNVTEMVVNWVTMDYTSDSIVEYNKKGGPLDLKAFGTVTKYSVNNGAANRTMYIHKVTLTGLVTTQYYDYHCGGQNGWSSIFTFRARTGGTDWSPMIALYGDLGNVNPKSLPFLQEESQRGDYDAILHVGDIAYNMEDDNGKKGDEFMRQIEPIAAYVPYMTCPGNHENRYNFTNYRYKLHLAMPSNTQTMYYSWNIGPAHIISITTEYYFYPNWFTHFQGMKQYEWLEQDLKEAASPANRTLRPWIITMGHRPMYCSNKDHDDCSNHESVVRTGSPTFKVPGLEDLFYKYGVDLELWAHEHSFERLFPVFNRQMCNGSKEEPYTNPCAPVHIITGSAGCYADHDPFKPYYGPWTAFRTTDYGYTRMNIANKTHLYMEQFSVDKPLHIEVITKGRSSNPSVRTLQRRKESVTQTRKFLCGDSETQVVTLHALEIKGLGEEQRAEIAKEAGLGVSVGPGEGVAMKAALGLPWNKIRHLRRWLQSWGVHLASEKKQRKVDKQNEIEGLHSELMPFTFKIQDGIEIRMAPSVQITSLTEAVYAHLDSNAEQNRLTWHNGLIPDNEIWVKIGGDKGGGSFKCSFEIANLDCPNSCQNSVVFSIIKAPDSATNLHLAMDRYKEEINILQQSTWRGKQIRVFIFGDYAFLSILYGLSGASGYHCCLWCLIPKTKLKMPQNERPIQPKRTVELIIEDNERFMGAGSPLKKAKHYNNAIDRPFFNVPLIQVCLPGLHLSLGIFKRLHLLLIQELHLFDLSLANLVDKNDKIGNKTFLKYIDNLKTVHQLDQMSAELKQLAEEQDEIIAFFTMSGDIHDGEILLIKEEARNLHRTAQQKETEAKELLSKNPLENKNGPCVQRLEKELQQIGVHPQAYHGGDFIGNHVNTALKVKNINIMVSVAKMVCDDHEGYNELLPDAEAIRDKFTPLFTSFSKCHNIYSKKEKLDEQQILELEGNIKFFLVYYRNHFPNASITPKLHILEDHLMEWVMKYKTGFGLLGEQGAESLHSQFNQLGREYCNVKDDKTRLYLMVKEQHRRCHPSNIGKAPKVQKRNLSQLIAS